MSYFNQITVVGIVTEFVKFNDYTIELSVLFGSDPYQSIVVQLPSTQKTLYTLQSKELYFKIAVTGKLSVVNNRHIIKGEDFIFP